jgi:IS5 family transposase
MGQLTFTDIEYSNRKRRTKRDEFLKIMEEIIPWSEWVLLIKPFYFDNIVGRPARGIETMLRMFLLQSWFNLSDEGVEDAIYDSYAFRCFMNFDFTEDSVPDATTLCKFRKILVDNKIAELLFKAVNKGLEKHGHIMSGGSIIDATIIEAPSSTKNSKKSRDPEMQQCKKGNQWHFGMKLHIGVDAGAGYTHSVSATSANVHDISVAHELIREDDGVAYGDAGYIGLEKREEIINDQQKSKIEFRINKRSGKSRKMPEGYARTFEQFLEREKSKIRSKVEHIFMFIKHYFGYRKTVYKGIAKNLHRLQILLCSTNLLMCARSGGWRPI